MNLPGPYQREMINQGKEGAWIALAFRSRPDFQTHSQAVEFDLRTVFEGSAPRPATTCAIPGWRAAVWDEVCATADGALLRTIKILITDGPQSEPEETT